MIEPLVIGSLIGSLGVALWVYRLGWNILSDSATLTLMSAGVRVSSPFRWRVLIPLLLRPLVKRAGPPPWRPRRPEPFLDWVYKPALWVWSALSWGSLIACTAIIAYIGDRAGAPAWLCATLFVGLPWYRILSMAPFMTDQLGMLCALLCVVLPVEYALPVCIIGGMAHERSAVFAAIFSWNPAFLIGIIPPMLTALFGKKGAAQPWELGWVDKPLSGAIPFHRAHPLWSYVAPWGAVLLGIEPTLQMAALVIVSYGQLLVARDQERLYQWMAPALIVPAAILISLANPLGISLIVLFHIFSPTQDPASRVGKKPNFVPEWDDPEWIKQRKVNKMDPTTTQQKQKS